jgi:transposase
MMITRKRAKELLEVLDEVRETHFKDRKKDYPYSEWEKKREKVKERLRNLREYIKRAVDLLQREEQKAGRPPKLDLEKKTMLFLFTRWINKSNRGTEEALEAFQPLFGFDVSYKTIERLYSDEEVKAVLHNLFVLLIEEEGTSGNFSGDGSGYSLSVEEHYRTEPIKEGRKYLYVLRIIDIETNLYVGIGFSKVSEMDAYKKAIALMKKINVEIDSISLDKYYSSRKVIEAFGRRVSIFVLPKENIPKIGIRWASIFRRIAEDPVGFLSRYFMRNLSESAYSADKRRFGSIVRQRREDRQETALFSIAVWHNIYATRVKPA